MLEYLSARTRTGWFAGVEVDSDALARARQRCPDATLLRGDAYHLPFAAGSFDLVLCLEVLEHLGDPARALRELRRVSCAACLVSVPHEPFFRLGNLVRGKNVSRLGNPVDHVQHWSARAFGAFCGQHLAVRTATTSFPWVIVDGTV